MTELTTKETKILKALAQITKTGAAEEENDYIEKIFLPPEQFENLLSGKTPLTFLIGQKGSGKSIIFVALQNHFEKKDQLCLRLTPDKMQNVLQELKGADDSIAALKDRFYRSLTSSIAQEIGNSLSSQIIPKNYNILRSCAIESGYSDKTFIEKLCSFPDDFGITGNFNFMNVNLTAKFGNEHKDNIQAISKAIKKYLSKKKFYILIDDIDQLGKDQSKASLDRIWGCLLALRQISVELEHRLSCIVSLRREIWNQLISTNIEGRDQIDHLRNLVLPLSHSKDFIEKIIDQRFEAAYRIAEQDCSEMEDNLPQLAKECCLLGQDLQVPGTAKEEKRSWIDYFSNQTRNRPRDAMQLLYQASDLALRRKEKINSEIMQNISLRYSSERIDDIINENQYACDHLRPIIEKLTQLNFRSNFNETKEILKKIPLQLPIGYIKIKGKTMKTNEEYTYLELWALLYELGILNPRKKAPDEKKGYRHLSYLDSPHFVSPQNLHEMQKVMWEIHPAYRSYLQSQKKDLDL